MEVENEAFAFCLRMVKWVDGVDGGGRKSVWKVQQGVRSLLRALVTRLGGLIVRLQVLLH